ncbi:hypothetical protein LOTGIDRAFT_160320 [Lottia gigantea]|uniref:Uncharacterized protein n=1 Tax=Lottia gigantea TaxID=225164 RepID=V4ALY6_LOTGI|nr:hypothetical protein LOTGIDRAFT_160320 [Lottia gigantea]ESO95775.1 hypothetical protein LOTGIDRAFT_160320 [Lottia gigantea]
MAFTYTNLYFAGAVPGLCHSTNLTVGHAYTVFLDYDTTNKKYTPTFKEDNVNDQYLEEISLVCEHDINYPNGITEDTATIMCPENYPDYEGCLNYVEPEPEDTSSNGISKDVVDNEVEVKPLTEGPPIVAPASNGDGAVPSTKDGGGNGSGVARVSCILYLGLIIYTLAL